MRLWHKELIPVLPIHQLLSQWRECCCIVRNIVVYGTPNHVLVNKLLEYPSDHFEGYCRMVRMELEKRGCNLTKTAMDDFNRNLSAAKAMKAFAETTDAETLFGNWHTNRYLWQCYFNLQEKYDCGRVPKEEWILVEDFAMGILSMGGNHE